MLRRLQIRRLEIRTATELLGVCANAWLAHPSARCSADRIKNVAAARDADSLCDGSKQVAKFVVQFFGRRDRLGNLLADEIAKVTPEPMNRDFDRAF